MTALYACAYALIWSTGFVVARFIDGAVEPTMFLFLRFSLAALALFALCALLRPRMPRLREAARHVGVGALLNGVYLCLGYLAVAQGLPVSVMTLLGGWQPVLALLVVAVLARRLPGRAVLAGVLVSLAGVALVLLPGLRTGGGEGVGALTLVLGLASVTALTLGVLAQSRVRGTALLPAVAWQAAGGAAVSGAVALSLGDPWPAWSGTLAAALTWSVLGISLTGMLLMVHLTRSRGPVFISVLVLTAPPLAALEAYLLFGETVTPVQGAGIAVALCGVGIAQLRRGEGRAG
ncbi:DMT family transporter [Brevibacterium album]|uniref:DMT family transporter n=1 Tax=Brevibacterium album TaxID=417948 RepID=UPI0003FDE288|nr:DMT family transporter [Brevibacterium album]